MASNTALVSYACLYNFTNSILNKFAARMQDNLVLSTELMMLIGHRKDIRKLTFRVLALRRSESRNCGLCGLYTER